MLDAGCWTLDVRAGGQRTDGRVQRRHGRFIRSRSCTEYRKIDQPRSGRLPCLPKGGRKTELLSAVSKISCPFSRKMKTKFYSFRQAWKPATTRKHFIHHRHGLLFCPPLLRQSLSIYGEPAALRNPRPIPLLTSNLGHLIYKKPGRTPRLFEIAVYFSSKNALHAR